MKKIVITGMGAVTPVGIGVDNYWKNIREDNIAKDVKKFKELMKEWNATFNFDDL